MNNWFYENTNKRKWLYEHGEMAEGEAIVESNWLITVLDILTSLFNRYPAYQRRFDYKFIAKDGKIYSGRDYVSAFFEPKKFFAMKNYKTKILYSAQDPEINIIYADRANKAYNKGKSHDC